MFSSVMMRDFNSIKVRLEHQEIVNRFAVAEFQFHKGAIRTQTDNFNDKLNAISIP